MGQALDEQINNLKAFIGEDKRNDASIIDNINILYYIDIINRHKRRLSLLAAITALVTLIVSISQPRVYVANVTFLLPGSRMAGSNLANLFGFQEMATGEINSSLIHLTVESRRMAEGVARQFNLKERYNLASFEQAVAMAKNMVRPYNIITGMAIEAKTSDPKLSADIANFCVDYLNVLNAELNLTTTKPMVKVLDIALPPSKPASRHTLHKILASSIFVFVGGTLVAFFHDYLRRLRARLKSRSDI